MVAIPTIEEEDARRPNRERQNLVTEQTRVTNQMKAIFVRFGIRAFRPTLRNAEEKLKGLRAAEGTALPDKVFGRRHDDLTTRSDDRRLKSAKARNRIGRWGPSVPQEGGAAGALWGFGYSGGADDVRARRVERYFGAIDWIRPVRTSAQ